jgi:osmotically-inducible protein OsmY
MKRRLLISLAGSVGATLLVVFVGCSTFQNIRGNNQYGADNNLSKRVEGQLKEDPLYKFQNISVSAYRGEVQLGGVINSEHQRQSAIRDAQSVQGVMGVKDNMIVNTNPPVMPMQ